MWSKSTKVYYVDLKLEKLEYTSGIPITMFDLTFVFILLDENIFWIENLKNMPLNYK